MNTDLNHEPLSSVKKVRFPLDYEADNESESSYHPRRKLLCVAEIRDLRKQMEESKCCVM